MFPGVEELEVRIYQQREPGFEPYDIEDTMRDLRRYFGKQVKTLRLCLRANEAFEEVVWCARSEFNFTYFTKLEHLAIDFMVPCPLF